VQLRLLSDELPPRGLDSLPLVTSDREWSLEQEWMIECILGRNTHCRIQLEHWQKQIINSVVFNRMYSGRSLASRPLDEHRPVFLTRESTDRKDLHEVETKLNSLSLQTRDGSGCQIWRSQVQSLLLTFDPGGPPF
jgi:hypothetical protein